MFTRITEFKHLTNQEHSETSVVREFVQGDGDPYYPIPQPENERLYRRHKALASAEPNVSFVGLLAQYRLQYGPGRCGGPEERSTIPGGCI